MKELAAMVVIGIAWIAIYLGILYIIGWCIILPIIGVIAKMFGCPGW